MAGCQGIATEIVATDRDSTFNGHLYSNFELIGSGFYDLGAAACPGPPFIEKLAGWVRTDRMTGKSYLYGLPDGTYFLEARTIDGLACRQIVNRK